jgi:hypothetical protein
MFEQIHPLILFSLWSSVDCFPLNAYPALNLLPRAFLNVIGYEAFVEYFEGICVVCFFKKSFYYNLSVLFILKLTQISKKIIISLKNVNFHNF